MKLSSVVKLSRARVIISMFLVLLGLWLVIARRNPRRRECTRQLSLACIPVVTALGPVVRRATVSEVDRPVGETRLASEIFPDEKFGRGGRRLQIGDLLGVSLPQRGK